MKFLIISTLVLPFILMNPLLGQSNNLDNQPTDYNLLLEKINEKNGLPQGWDRFTSKIVPPSNGYEFFCDTTVKKSGRSSFRIASLLGTASSGYGGLSRYIPANFEGKEIELKFFMKLEEVSNYAGFILRVQDANNNTLSFSNLQEKKLKGTKSWKLYSIKMPLPKDAHRFFIGPILSGTGKLWVDDIQLLVDGEDFSKAAPKADYNPNPPLLPRYGENGGVGKRIRIDSGELYYEIYGQGKPLLLLHGNSQTINAFEKQIPELSKEYKVIAVDTRGHGKSNDFTLGPLTYDLFAEDIKQLLDSLNITKTHILGWSDGGNTGLIMAIKYPEYIDKLAIMGAVISAGKEAVGSKVIKQVKNAIKSLDNRDDERSNRTARLYKMLLTEPHITLADLSKINSPVLVMAGERDMILPSHTKLIAKNITNSTLVIFKNATHFAPYEIPEVFNPTITEFLRGNISSDR